ncbi:MAG: hypothetical protein IPM64_17355 [Phycisphaerales bacterium]|nr:hypothetical protein [Phycisphaerales bacterium]
MRHCNQYLAIDIETVPNRDMLGQLPEPEVALGNLKDPDKIRDRIASASARQVNRMALDPHFGRVACAAIVRCKSSGERTVDVLASMWQLGGLSDASERELLGRIWEAIDASYQIVSFNGANFDFPFLLRRSLILGVQPVGWIPLDTRSVADRLGVHFDVYQYLESTDVGRGRGDGCASRSLAFFAKLLLGSTPPHPEVVKSDMTALLESNEGRAIMAANCTWDATATMALAMRIRGHPAVELRHDHVAVAAGPVAAGPAAAEGGAA